MKYSDRDIDIDMEAPIGQGIAPVHGICTSGSQKGHAKRNDKPRLFRDRNKAIWRKIVALFGLPACQGLDRDHRTRFQGKNRLVVGLNLLSS